ncbi:multicopper oxidase [Nocardioides aestuarii]|uniref:Copper oxidase n=1 Tax=Nocardioides aestuarii TaxID=252231 RepID=A0ABW4TK87_9ACTN
MLGTFLAAVLLALAVVGAQQLLHQHLHEKGEPGPLLHLIRDGGMAVPMMWLALVMAGSATIRREARALLPTGLLPVGWALLVSVLVGAATIPGDSLHGALFVEHGEESAEGAMGFVEHLVRDASSATLIALLVTLAMALVASPWGGSPWLRPGESVPRRSWGFRAWIAVLATGACTAGLAGMTAPAASSVAADPAPSPGCRPTFEVQSRTVHADVVSLDQAFDYNRLGATNPAGMIFALRHDVVLETEVAGVPAGTAISDQAAAGLSGRQLAGNVTLRPDKRPRPLTLRMNVGDCLEIHFQNLLGEERADSEQPADRHVGIHVKGLALVNNARDGGTLVGRNASGLVSPGDTATYSLYGDHENGYVMDNGAAASSGEAAGGTTPFGLFGAVNVEPWGTDAYRSQVTRMEMDLAASAWDDAGDPTLEPQYGEDGQPRVRLTADGQPIINYDATYPTDPDAVGYDAARAGAPIMRLMDAAGTLVHGDLNAVISGPRSNGWRLPAQDYPEEYWANQVQNQNQRRGQEPFREFTTIFHDEIFARQAFPEMFDDPATFQHTLHGVKDGFGINYGVSGVGAEVIANRLGLGPMADCTECKFEEFFLSAWSVGDPAMIVDLPANKVMAGEGERATYAKFPDDPSNVHHSYLNDRVKFRNLHAGPKEHHIFHLHAHQWQGTPNAAKSTYLDSQLIGPGASYTYEIAYGGSGNRNKTVGDSIFHCHFYPHFAQGMWELWRTHDTFERGTAMDGLRPAEGSRALPDGEITAGTPIPAIVPLPGKPMAPSPNDDTSVVAADLDGDGPGQPSSQVDVNGDGVADVEQNWLQDLSDPVDSNPGYPFFVPGAAGHRPPTPPLDLVRDGGLPRHVILGGEATSYVTPRDLNKVLETALISYPAEDGTPAEKAAMAYHAKAWHSTYASAGLGVAPPVSRGSPQVTGGVQRLVNGFETNGLPPAPGAPYADPCRTDGTAPDGSIEHAGVRDLTYKAAVIQLDAVFNKAGWHFPQQRIEALWNDVSPTLRGDRPPEPLVMRLAAGDCASLWHTNLVPNVYELDDYQVRTPTDVIGQHIHLVKFDVTSADGSGNGFNYEDGTLSPQEVEERIHAVRAGTEAGGQPFLGVGPQACTTGGEDARLQAGEKAGTPQCPTAVRDPFFGGQPGVGDLAWGARTTIQRWYADPVLNESWDAGHGSVFTHDHFGPSTHQQTGLYATVLVEPQGATWWDPESGKQMGARQDGGPTSWRADIRTADASRSHREFYLEFGDFQHAYRAGGGTLHTADNLDGKGTRIPSYADPANAINPSFRVPAESTPDLFAVPDVCPNGDPRPCPEAISADDVGTMVVNYRNEPVALRVFDPVTKTQATGDRGDLAFAFQSRTDRAMPELNTQPALYPRPTYVKPGDPYTPLLRAYAGDRIRLRMQVGATEEQHNFFVQGMKWKGEPLNESSGWRAAQPAGISEYFVVDSPVLPDSGRGSPAEVDYLWGTGAATEDLWNGTWGLLRSYQKQRKDLAALPGHAMPTKNWSIGNLSSFNGAPNAGTCPTSATVRRYDVSAMRAADLLGPDGLTYNSRGAKLVDAEGNPVASGRLVDPTALIYVLDSDLVINKKTNAVSGLKPGVPVEPLVMRAAAGDCLKVKLTNRLPAVVPDLPGYNALPPLVDKDPQADGSRVSFNANDVRPSSVVGLNAPLVNNDVRTSNGTAVGGGTGGVRPGGTTNYTWYAGDVSAVRTSATTMNLVARPVEFGAVGLSSADLINGASKGLVGALVIEPPGSSWAPDAGSRLAATVTSPGGLTYREQVLVLQDDIGMRFSGDCPGVPADMQCAVPAMPSEGKGVPEDAEDSGQKAINYRSDPLWYRLGVSPDVPFEEPILRDNPDASRLLSNSMTGGDPWVPILEARAGQQVRIHVVQPGGHARGHVIAIDGHSWQRYPRAPATTASSDDSDRISWAFHDDPIAQDHAAPGHLPLTDWIGAQEGMGPAINHSMVLPQAGGPFGVDGDYLISDSASFGRYQGLWALLRVSGGTG